MSARTSPEKPRKLRPPICSQILKGLSADCSGPAREEQQARGHARNAGPRDAADLSPPGKNETTFLAQTAIGPQIRKEPRAAVGSAFETSERRQVEIDEMALSWVELVIPQIPDQPARQRLLVPKASSISLY